MAQQAFRRLINLVFAISALIALSAGALAQGSNGYPNDMKPGSVLFFNKYTSNSSDPQQGDTQINITNTNQNSDIAIHVFLVDGSACTVADAFIGLTKNQTASFLMSDIDPGITGYIVAVAVDNGPTQFNFLIGDAYIRETDGRQANLAAVAIARLSDDSVEADENGAASLVFDDDEYERLPASVALSSFNSQVTHNTQVNLYVPSNNLIIGATPTTTSVFTLVYDDRENLFSTTVRFVCYTTIQLRSLRLAGGAINTIIPANNTGWIRFDGGGKPLLGASIQSGPVFMGGHNLHTLKLLPTYTITVPAFGF